jgi:Tfp pilus assembly protein PilN
MRPLNLASRPFRNERLPQVVLSVASVLVLALTVFHGRAIYRLLPGKTSELYREVNQLEEEGRRLRSDAARLRTVKPNPADAERWAALKELVDRRVFPWTRLFAVLEEVLPKGVRLVTIVPGNQKSGFEVELQAMARSSEEGLQMIEALQARPEFDDVRPESRGNQTDAGVPYRYSLKYNPAAAPPPQPSPSPAAEADPSPAAEAAPSPAAAPGEQR